MRLVLATALSLALAAPAFAADVAPEAQAGVAAVTALAKAPKNARVRKVKVNAAGDVCGTVSTSADARDMEFVWTKASGEVWINEAPQEPNSAFVYGAAQLRRSAERDDYKIWKACQKG